MKSKPKNAASYIPDEAQYVNVMHHSTLTFHSYTRIALTCIDHELLWKYTQKAEQNEFSKKQPQITHIHYRLRKRTMVYRCRLAGSAILESPRQTHEVLPVPHAPPRTLPPSLPAAFAPSLDLSLPPVLRPRSFYPPALRPLPPLSLPTFSLSPTPLLSSPSRAFPTLPTRLAVPHNLP